MTLVAVHQMRSRIDPFVNLECMISGIEQASIEGSTSYFAPEMSLLLDRDRNRAAVHMSYEADNKWMPILQKTAARYGIWSHIGSIPVLHDDASGRLANRTYIIDPLGRIAARYDKMHLFDVDLATGESWRESNVYRGGDAPMLADFGPIGIMGLSICYDIRFPDLYSYYARRNAHILAVPAAFTVPTGEAHWHVLLRARAIESEAFVIAAAQCGLHEDGRRTYGHSLVVDPWGEVLLDMGDEEGVGFAELDIGRLAEVRSQIPVHANRQTIETG